MILEEYHQAKQRHPNMLVLFRIGDFFELYGEDAETAAKDLGLVLTTRTDAVTAVNAACQRLGLPAATHGTAQLFSGQATGLIVKFPGWEYPAVIDPLTGTMKYDNFGGAWGDEAHLHKFLQAYAVERVKLESRKKGFTVSEQTLDNGSIKLQVVESA